MYYLIFIILGLSYVELSGAYVLLQVRKQDDNLTNVDALIHKVVPSGTAEKIASKFARKQYTNANEKSDIENSIDNVVLAIDTGAAKEEYQKSNSPDIVDKIVKAVSGFISRQSGFRSQDIMKPEIIHFRSDKPSVMFEINSKAIINAFKDILSSKTVAHYIDKLTKEAAVVYRTIQNEISKQ